MSMYGLGFAGQGIGGAQLKKISERIGKSLCKS
jgi:hypothetical protein